MLLQDNVFNFSSIDYISCNQHITTTMAVNIVMYSDNGYNYHWGDPKKKNYPADKATWQVDNANPR